MQLSHNITSKFVLARQKKFKKELIPYFIFIFFYQNVYLEIFVHLKFFFLNFCLATFNWLKLMSLTPSNIPLQHKQN